MSKDFVLAPGERLQWEGRPAPRCYTFRHWRHSVFGLVFLAMAIGWEIYGFEMAENYAAWLVWLPLPFLLVGLYLSAGHLVQARLEWNHVQYAITNQRLLARRGLCKQKVTSMSLSEIIYFRLDRKGENLGTLRVCKDGGQQLILHCLEYPHQAAGLLEAALRNGDET
jgi:hypothetical protein